MSRDEINDEWKRGKDFKYRRSKLTGGTEVIYDKKSYGQIKQERRKRGKALHKTEVVLNPIFKTKDKDKGKDINE